jgi:hypothetical protein
MFLCLLLGGAGRCLLLGSCVAEWPACLPALTWPASPAVTQNAFGELCALQKVEGCGMTPPHLMRCIRLATQKVGCRLRCLPCLAEYAGA